jgi:pantoate kinase
VEASAFSPANITGIFEICDKPSNFLLKGSRGASVSIKAGAFTKVKINEAKRPLFEIKINGKKTKKAVVSICVIKNFLSMLKHNYKISVEHEFKVPIGAGFGSSGAGALSLSLALNKALNLGLSRIQAAQIAHIADVSCKTGLGTVTAETYGGLKIGLKPGAPGIAEIRKIKVPKSYVVACLYFSPISTKAVLSNEVLRKRINKIGGKIVDELKIKPNPEKFMQLSRDFAENVGLITKRMRRVLNETDKKGFVCSMMMLGESIFTLIKKNEIDELLKVYKKYAINKKDIIVSEIDFNGARYGGD